MNTNDNESILGISAEFQAMWRTVMARTPRDLRERIAAIVDAGAERLASVFYDAMLEHPHAKLFLDSEVVNKRLRASMARWARQLYATLDDPQIPAAVAQQIHVGAVHARFKLPPHLMQLGFFLISTELRAQCTAQTAEAERHTTFAYLADMFFMTDSLMLSSFVHDMQTHIRREEAYRLISMEHDVSLERERQRAALSEWVNQFLVSLQLKSRAGSAGTLARSEFGLWLNHKAKVFFDGVPDLEHVFDVVETVDEVYLPQLLAGGDIDHVLIEFERRIDFIRYLVNDMFARMGKLQLGRDSVTRLLNQRYLPAILGAETTNHAQSGKSFAVALIKVDALRRAVPMDDPEGRNVLLQQLSVAIVDTVRAGDHAFRYNEDSFLIVMVEIDAKRAAAASDDLRLRIRAMDFHLQHQQVKRITVSVGVAAFDGHPDYQYLLQRAEEATTRASANGGDKVVTT